MTAEPRTMQAAAHIAILRRTGTVLIVVGVLDMAWMVYCLATGQRYASSLNVFAVVAGVLLMRGSLKAAGVVRFFAVFLLAAMCVMALALPFHQPVGLMLAQVRLNPDTVVLGLTFAAALLALLAWVQRQLGSEAVQQARRASGTKAGGARLPASLGIVLVLALNVGMVLTLNGESGRKAKVLARQQLGGDYRYDIASLRMSSSNRGTHVRATVTAWNEREVRTVPIEWRE